MLVQSAPLSIENEKENIVFTVNSYRKKKNRRSFVGQLCFATGFYGFKKEVIRYSEIDRRPRVRKKQSGLSIHYKPYEPTVPYSYN